MFLIGLAIYAVFAIITGAVKVRVNRRERLIRENIVVISVTRALSGIGNSIAIPAGFGLIGATIKQEPARTIVFSMFGEWLASGSVGLRTDLLHRSRQSRRIGSRELHWWRNGKHRTVGDLPLLGLTGRGAWSYLFFLLAGLSVITFVAAIVVIPSDVRVSTDQDTRIDWVGGALVTSAMCLFTFSLADSGLAPKGWRTPCEFGSPRSGLMLIFRRPRSSGHIPPCTARFRPVVRTPRTQDPGVHPTHSQDVAPEP